MARKLFSTVSVALRLFILLLVIIAVILILTAPGACYRRSLNGQQTSYEICPNSNYFGSNVFPNNNFLPNFGGNPNAAFATSGIGGYPMDASRWSSQYELHLRGDGQRVWGQVAIIIIALLVAIPGPLVGIVGLFSTKRLIGTQISLIVLGLVVFLILGGVETWYATGYSHMGRYISQTNLNGGCTQNVGIPGLCEVFFVVKGWAAAAALLFLSAFFSLVDVAVTFATRDNVQKADVHVAPVVWTKKTTRVSI